jgi:Zn-dependent peptidase ImmA (M78 family)
VTSTRDLHYRAMALFETALLARRRGDESRMQELLSEALQLETAAADSVAEDYSLEPTRSVLHRSAASLGLQSGNFDTAKRYAEAGLQGQPPAEIKEELTTLVDQILTAESLRTAHRRAPAGPTQVQKVIRRFTMNAPVNIVGLAESLGVSVRERDLGSNSGEIFRDLERGGFSGYCIFVNVLHAWVRKRFTIAHELGHFLRHRDRLSNRLIDDHLYRSPLGTTKENEANSLAADLLMPRKLIGQFRAAGITTPEKMAQKFDVSVEAMKVRLRVRI